MTPTARTLALCRSFDWVAGVVERYNHHTRKSTDLFGFADIVALDDGPGALFIQATTNKNATARARKICQKCHAEARLVILAGNRVQVWGWRKLKEGNRYRWRCRIIRILLHNGDFVLEDLG